MPRRTFLLLQEFIYYMIFTACFVITAIAAAAQATSQFPSIAATAVRTTILESVAFLS